MKIKRKVEMTHEEYAKYMIDKFGIASYERELIDNNIFDAPMEFEQTFTLKPMRKDDGPVIERSFRGVVIEVEEEITEETKLEFLLDHFINPYGQHYVGNVYHNRSINDVLEENDEMEIATNSIHLFDKKTKEFKLIWRDGKLVD